MIGKNKKAIIMTQFKLHTLETAPEGSKEIRELLKAGYFRKNALELVSVPGKKSSATV